MNDDDLRKLEHLRQQLNLTPEEAADIQRKASGGSTLGEIRNRQPKPNDPSQPPTSTDDPIGMGSTIGVAIGVLVGLGYGFANGGFGGAIGGVILGGLIGLALGAAVGWLIKNAK